MKTVIVAFALVFAACASTKNGQRWLGEAGYRWYGYFVYSQPDQLEFLKQNNSNLELFF